MTLKYHTSPEIKNTNPSTTHNKVMAISGIYTDHITFFADILGFKNKISKKEPHEDDFTISSKDPNEAYNILKAAEIISRLNPEINGQKVKTSQFSDSIAITYAIDDEINNNIAKYDKEIQEFFSIVGYCFWCFLQHGGMIRGSITLGSLHHQGNRIFGPALVEAHYLESKIAKYPRIIISKYLRDKSIDIKIENHIKRDNDGIYFVDVLCDKYKTYEYQDEKNNCWPPHQNKKTYYKEKCKLIQDFVKNSRTEITHENNGDERINEKINWLDEYSKC